MHRFWKWLKRIAPAPKPGRLLTPVRKQNLSPTTHVHAQIREEKHSCWTWISELSNSLFSFLLSLLHSSIVLVRFEFALFLSALINFVFCLLCYIFFPFDPSISPRILICFVICCVLPTPPPHSAPTFFFRSLAISSLGDAAAATLCSLRPAWQGTDLMHNHVLADVDRSCVDLPGRRSSVSRPELSSDLSEDSDYDSIWTSHSYRMGSVPRKSCISHQN